MTFKDGLIELAQAVWLIGTLCLGVISWGAIVTFAPTAQYSIWIVFPVALILMILVFAATMWSIFRWIDH